MLFAFAFVTFCTIFTLAQGAAVLDAQAGKKCYTTHTGYFETGLATEFAAAGLDSEHRVVFPAKYGTKFKVEFQAC